MARRVAISLYLVLMVALIGSPAHASAPTPVALSDADRADIGRVETYLNGLGTASASFVQANDDGSLAQGKLWLSRPGKMRFEYDPPTPLLMVADGSFLVYYDSSVKQVSYLPLGETPLDLLLRPHVRLSGDVTLTEFDHKNGVIRVSLVETKQPGQGSLTIVLSDNPTRLDQWIVIDAQNHRTQIALQNFQTGMDLAPKLFRFVNPKLGIVPN